MHAHVALGELDQRVAEALGVGRPGGLGFRARLDLGLGGARDLGRALDAVHALGMGGRLGVALALLRQEVQQHDALEALGALEVLDDQVHVVSIERTDVGDAQFLEDMARHDRVAHHLAELVERLVDPGADHGDGLDEVRHLVVRALHDAIGADLRQVARQRADRLADRPLVVVQHDDHALARRGRVVERLEGDARAQRRVADHRDDVRSQRLVARRHGEAEPERDRRAGVAGVEQVVFALVRVGEAAHAVGLAQRLEARAPAGQELVDVALVRDIEHQSVAVEVEYAVQRHRQLDHAQVGSEVPAGLLHAGEQEAARLVAQRRQGLRRQSLEVRRRGDRLEQGQALGRVHGA